MCVPLEQAASIAAAARTINRFIVRSPSVLDR
jgi:hypothetical protein